MDVMIKLNNQTAGRDKLIRLLQYGSRTYWYYAQDTHRTKHSAEVLRDLEFTFSSFRKLLRLGRCLDSLYQAVKMTKYPELMVKLTLTMAKIANSLYLLADHIIWIGRTGILRIDVEKWNRVANKYWLASIAMNLARDIYEIGKTFGREWLLERVAKRTMFRRHRMLSYLKNHKGIVMDTVKNGCDLFIPLTALGYTRCTPGMVGFLGITSSLIGLYTLIDPCCKIYPS